MASTIAEATRRTGALRYVIYQISERRYAVGEIYPEDIRHFVVESPDHRQSIMLGTEHGLSIYRMRPLTRPVIQGLAFWHYALCLTGRIDEIPEAHRLGRWPS